MITVQTNDLLTHDLNLGTVDLQGSVELETVDLYSDLTFLVSGLQGPQGIQGIQGPKGDKGDKGDRGPEGPKGDSPSFAVENIPNGYDIVFEWEDGSLHSVSVYNGAKGDKGDKGDQGDLGIQGPQGIQGELGYSIKSTTVYRDKFTEALWNLYGTIGHYENWTSTNNDGFRLGDLFIIYGNATDTGEGHWLLYSYSPHPKGNSTLYGVCKAHVLIPKGDKGEKGDKGDTGPLGEHGICNYNMIIEDDVDVSTDATKGVAPFNTSYGYTNITIKNPNIHKVEGGIYSFIIDTKMVSTSAYRNVRVRFGEDDDWHPVMNYTTGVIGGNGYFVKNMTCVFVYKSTIRPEGAFHLHYDANTTYTLNYLIDSDRYKCSGIIHRYELFGFDEDGNIMGLYTNASYSNASKKTPQTKGFILRPFENYNSTTQYAEGSYLSGSSYTHKIRTSLDIRYVIQYTTTFAINTPIYLKFKLGGDGLLYLPLATTDDPNPIYHATALPTTDDGYIYRYIGRITADNSYNCYLGDIQNFYKWNGSKYAVVDEDELKGKNNALYGVLELTITWEGSTSTGYTYTISNKKYGYIPQLFIDLATYSKGKAVFNSETGYFELNGLTDISYKEMLDIYLETNKLFNNYTNQYIADSGKFRTNLLSTNTTSILFDNRSAWTLAFRSNNNLRVLNVATDLGSRTATYKTRPLQIMSAFLNCAHLKEIIGEIDVSYSASMFNEQNPTADNWLSHPFSCCYSLEEVRLWGLRQRISFQNSPNLSDDSILYMILNRYTSLTSAITIKLHPTAYARAMQNEEIVAAIAADDLINVISV